MCVSGGGGGGGFLPRMHDQFLINQLNKCLNILCDMYCVENIIQIIIIIIIDI